MLSFLFENPDSTDRILDAAMKVFARKPADAVSLRTVAAEAGVPVSLIMYHFKSKNGLYEAVFDRAMAHRERFLRPYFDMWDDDTILTREQAGGILSQLVNSLMDGLYSDPLPTSHPERILLAEKLYPSKSHDRFYEKFFRRKYELWARIVMTFTGKDDPETAFLYVSMIQGQIFGFRIVREILLRFLGATKFGKEETERMKALVLRNVFLILESELAEKYFDELCAPLDERTKPDENAPKEPDVDSPEPDYSIASVERIIDTATRLFSRQSVDTVSLHAIAGEAGVKVPLLIYHFKSKANLYRIVVERIMDVHMRQIEIFQEMIRQRTPVSQTAGASVVREFISWGVDNIYDLTTPLESRENILLYEYLHPSEFYNRFYGKFFRHHFESLFAGIESALPPQKRTWAYLHTAAVFGMLFAFRLDREILVRSIGLTGFSEDEKEKIKSLLIRGVFLMLEIPVSEIK